MFEEQLSRQELIYIACALRVAAGVADSEAGDGKFFSSRAIFERSASDQRALADKVERIAKQMR